MMMISDDRLLQGPKDEKPFVFGAFGMLQGSKCRKNNWFLMFLDGPDDFGVAQGSKC